MGYDAAGQRTLKELANGTRASYTYDAAGYLTGLYNLKSDASVVSSFDYEYDAAGNRTHVVESSSDRVTWTYDATYQLIAEHRSGTNTYANTFTYDALGNRLIKAADGARTTSTYDLANQLQTALDSSGTTTYTFDADGNQQRVVAPGGDRTTTTWNYENQPTLTQLPDASRVTMVYNADNLRVEKQSSAGTANFIWNGQAYLLETNESGVTQATYTNEPTQYGNLISQRRGATTNYYNYDALGSTRELTSDVETTTDTHLYNAFGGLVTSSGSTVNPFRYVGQLGYYFDAETGDYYVRARVYRPVIARWLSVDPFWFRRVLESLSEYILLNYYTYVDNNPLDGDDPGGLQNRGKRKQPVKCNMRICQNPIEGAVGAVGAHLYIVLERTTVKGDKLQWGYRGGPGGSGAKGAKRGEGCDCTATNYGQLIGTHGKYEARNEAKKIQGFVDYVDRGKENCKSIVVDAPNCEAIHACLVDVLTAVDDCCIIYTPVPAPLGLGDKCNSNCVVGWMLQICAQPKLGVGVLPLPIGRLTPGADIPVPKCVREKHAAIAKKRKQGGPPP